MVAVNVIALLLWSTCGSCPRSPDELLPRRVQASEGRGGRDERVAEEPGPWSWTWVRRRGTVNRLRHHLGGAYCRRLLVDGVDRARAAR